jgi:hypothetical protein
MFYVLRNPTADFIRGMLATILFLVFRLLALYLKTDIVKHIELLFSKRLSATDRSTIFEEA